MKSAPEKSESNLINKAQVLKDLKEAVEELNLVLAEKLEARDADELLNEL